MKLTEIELEEILRVIWFQTDIATDEYNEIQKALKENFLK